MQRVRMLAIGRPVSTWSTTGGSLCCRFLTGWRGSDRPPRGDRHAEENNNPADNRHERRNLTNARDKRAKNCGTYWLAENDEIHYVRRKIFQCPVHPSVAQQHRADRERREDRDLARRLRREGARVYIAMMRSVTRQAEYASPTYDHMPYLRRRWRPTL